VKKSLISLALAGTLSASQFLGNVKEFTPNTTLQELNAQESAFKKQNAKSLSEEQIKVFEDAITIMMEVNEKTFSDFFPTLEISLQKWVKEDATSVQKAMNTIEEFLNIRLKQYTNMKKILKGKNPPKNLITQIEKMEKLSREAKRTLQKYKSDIEIILSVKKAFSQCSDIPIADFWLPTISEHNNNILVKLEGIHDDDFDTIERYESLLNEKIDSKYIDTIMVA